MRLSFAQITARRLRPVIEKYAARIYGDAVKFTPRKTGALERAVYVKTKILNRDFDKDTVEIGVRPNRKAAVYAHYIHDLRYIKWWKRGPGTIAKGRNARELFLTRAHDKWIDQFNAAVDKAAENAADEYAKQLANRLSNR